MPGFVVTSTATVTCTHQGKATPTVPASRVSIMGMPAITDAVPYAIAGCPLASGGAPFCATGKFIVAATRVTSMGQALVIIGSTSTCAATGQPMLITATQTRVSAT
jgi:hypothetical protein